MLQAASCGRRALRLNPPRGRASRLLLNLQQMLCERLASRGRHRCRGKRRCVKREAGQETAARAACGLPEQAGN
eukprot:5762816-Prymnesium_polylepis.1